MKPTRMFLLYFLVLFFCLPLYAQPVKIIFSGPPQGAVFGSHEDDSYVRNNDNNFNSYNSVEYSEVDYYPVVYVLKLRYSTSYFYGSLPVSSFRTLPVYFPVSAYYPANAKSRVPTIVVGTPAIGNLIIKPVNRSNYPAQQQGIEVRISSPR